MTLTWTVSSWLTKPHTTQARKHGPTLTIPVRAGEVYKATLLLLLNKDPHLPHERSTGGLQDVNAKPAGGTVDLFNAYSVIDRENKSFLFGNLVRLVCAAQHGQLEYKQPATKIQNEALSLPISTYTGPLRVSGVRLKVHPTFTYTRRNRHNSRRRTCRGRTHHYFPAPGALQSTENAKTREPVCQ